MERSIDILNPTCLRCYILRFKPRIELNNLTIARRKGTTFEVHTKEWPWIGYPYYADVDMRRFAHLPENRVTVSRYQPNVTSTTAWEISQENGNDLELNIQPWWGKQTLEIWFKLLDAMLGSVPRSRSRAFCFPFALRFRTQFSKLERPASKGRKPT